MYQRALYILIYKNHVLVYKMKWFWKLSWMMMGAFKDFVVTIWCEDPNPNLYTFVGNFEYERQVFALDPSQILLRDSKPRNTTFIYGVVIFTGHDSKVMQNSTSSPSKRSGIEKKMDHIIYILFTLLVLISLISSIGFPVKMKFGMPQWWYLQP